MCDSHNVNELYFGSSLQAPNAQATSGRALRSQWQSQHTLAKPTTALPDLRSNLSEHCGAFDAAERAFLEQLSSAALADCSTHAGMAAALRSVALLASTIHAAADAAAFQGGMQPAGARFTTTIQIACTTYVDDFTKAAHPTIVLQLAHAPVLMCSKHAEVTQQVMLVRIWRCSSLPYSDVAGAGLSRFQAGSALYTALLSALSALFSTPSQTGGRALVPAAAAALLSPHALPLGPAHRGSSGSGGGSRGGGTQRPAFATQATQQAGSARMGTQGLQATQAASVVPTSAMFSSTPADLDNIPNGVADAVLPALTPAVLQSLQQLTVALAGIKRANWFALNCTGDTFTSLANACQEQLITLHQAFSDDNEQQQDTQAAKTGSWMSFSRTQNNGRSNGSAQATQTGMGSTPNSGSGGGNAVSDVHSLTAAQQDAAHGRALACLVAIAEVEPQTAHGVLQIDSHSMLTLCKAGQCCCIRCDDVLHVIMRQSALSMAQACQLPNEPSQLSTCARLSWMYVDPQGTRDADALNAVLDVLDPQEELNASLDDPKNIPAPWVVGLTRAAWIIAARVGTQAAWSDAHATKDLTKIGLHLRLAWDPMVREDLDTCTWDFMVREDVETYTWDCMVREDLDTYTWDLTVHEDLDTYLGISWCAVAS